MSKNEFEGKLVEYICNNILKGNAKITVLKTNKYQTFNYTLNVKYGDFEECNETVKYDINKYFSKNDES